MLSDVAVITCNWSAGSPICGALLTGRYLWWAPAIFCGVCLFSDRMIPCIGDLTHVLVQAVALTSGLFFVGVRFSFVHASAGVGVARTRTSSESEGSLGNGSQKEAVKA